jgi:hypothetical protein
MQTTARAEYALRAAAVLAALTRAGILSSLRGADGGYELTRAPATLADLVAGRLPGLSPVRRLTGA